MNKDTTGTVEPLQADMFGPPVAYRQSSIEGMYRLIGQIEGAYCQTCVHLVRREFSKTYFKCGLTKMTGGPATDWRAKWSACGRYDEADHG